jgi:hypothetical protein
MTRGDWYAKKYGGGWRTVRKVLGMKCGRFGCFHVTVPGDQHFDTRQVTEWPKTLCICAKCANEELKEPPP